MKTTMDYMIGNTAVQIVNKGNCIKVVDVKKRQVRRQLIRSILIGLVLTAIMICASGYVIMLNNRQTMLYNDVFQLKEQVTELEMDKANLEKSVETESIDYTELMNKAKALGMKFPTQEQVYTYQINKSTMVRMNEDSKMVE